MKNTTIRIRETSRDILRDLAAREGLPMQTILDRAIEIYRRQTFLTEVNKAYAALRDDTDSWAEVEKERAAFDSTLNDGLDPDEMWTEDGEIVGIDRKENTV
jgi:hypothetical protein